MRLALIIISCGVLLSSCWDKPQGEKRHSENLTGSPKTDRPVINPFASVDVSPMDMSYWPVNYPQRHMAGTIKTPPLARVIYSRPQLQGRKIFPEIIQYEQVWRMGANEATELQLFKDAEIEGQAVKAGRYTLYCIPHPDFWTIILNKTTDTWGLQEDNSNELIRVAVPVTKRALVLEHFTMVFVEKETMAELLTGWGDLETRIRFKF